jgi:hypothetical protein
MSVGLAMQMRFRLARLADHHGVTPVLPSQLALAPPSDRPVIVEGIAAHAGSIDSDRQMFRRYSLALPRSLPPLLYRHDPKQPAGHIDELSHDSDGNLHIRATVTHEMAKRCPAFSVAAKITAYELRDENTQNFHALITAAEIVEISLTPTPANPNAGVAHRYPQFAGVAFHDHAIAGFNKAIEILKLLQQLDAQAPPPRAPAARRPTQFQSLVQAMQQRQQ